MKRLYWGGWMLALVAMMSVSLPVGAQDHGSGHSGGGAGCGDAFGDLIHIKRHAETGQPILAKRWVELPKDVPGYGWGYCPIAVDELGNELLFADLSCDVEIGDAEKVVEVDYFGRLNGGRTKERNQRMHFNEVIDNIKAACRVKQDETGRLKIGYCDDRGKHEEWLTVDSPMESMGLYVRLMKYGHIQTDPDEVDHWAHGDPATGPQLQPALGPQDWLKFDSSVQHLLPGWVQSMNIERQKARASVFEDPWISSCFTDDDEDGVYEVTEPFTDSNKDGSYTIGEPFSDLDGDEERDAFTESFEGSCAQSESLTSEDFIRAGFFMAGAASKTGQITEDLTQYFNRIVKITKNTAHTAATPATLPALVRVCEVDGELSQDEGQSEPEYDDCSVVSGGSGHMNAELFPDVTERFVDFGQVEYDRMEWRDETIEGVFPVDAAGELWQVYSSPFGQVVPLMGWLAYVNGPDPFNHYYYEPTFDIMGFVESARDGLRSIEFVHNHAIPIDLWPDYFAVSAPKKPVEEERILQ